MKKIIAFFLLTSVGYGQDLAQHLQNISVTVRAGNSSGSGVLFTREIDGQQHTLMWTAAHVIDSLRTTRTIIDKDGQERTKVEFKDAEVIKELTDKGRKIGELKILSKVIKYSDSENGHDLALLLVRKQDLIQDSVQFYLKDDIPPLGTSLFHIGSMGGQIGSNSMTSGIISQIGRVLDIGNSEGVLLDQTSCIAVGGSSGGGVFFADGEHAGQYLGMLVRGGSPGFNFVVPIRRMKNFCQNSNIMWALDKNEKAPTLDDIINMSIESNATVAQVQNKDIKSEFLIHSE